MSVQQINIINLSIVGLGLFKCSKMVSLLLSGKTHFNVRRFHTKKPCEPLNSSHGFWCVFQSCRLRI